MQIIIGLPAYNEEPTIASIVEQCLKYGKCIVADDGSTDDTLITANSSGATVIRHTENEGYGSSIQSILHYTKRHEADILVILDADGQHNSGNIPLLINELNKGYDIVIGSRKLQSYKIPRYRRLGLFVLRVFTNIAARTHLEDTESGFRAYSKKAISTLELTQNGMAISAEIIIKASRKGLKIGQVPIDISYDNAKPSKNPVSHGVSNLIYVVKQLCNN